MSPWGRLLSLLQPYRWKIAGAGLASALPTAGWLLLPLLFKEQFAGAFTGNLGTYSVELFLEVGTFLVAIAIASYYGFYLVLDIAHAISADLRTRYIDHLLQLPLVFHRNEKSGELIDRLVTCVGDIEHYIKHMLIGTLAGTVLFCGSIVLMFTLSWRLALVVVLAFPLLSLCLRWLMDEARRTLNESATAGGIVTAFIHDLLLNIDAAKAYNAREYEVERFQERQQEMLRRQHRWALRSALMEPLLILTITLANISLLLYGGWLVSIGKLDTPSFIATLFYAALLVPQARGISILYLGWQKFCNALRRLDDILLRPVESDSPGSIALPMTASASVEITNVSFAYQNGTQALNNFSLRVAPGGRVGIVGASGAGKTTLFSLLQRMYLPDRGHIAINGMDIRNVTTTSLRDMIALVPQDTMLFDETILNNVRYGRRTATDHEVQEACKAAQAHEFIAEFPRQYHTMVGERGTQLSGGQRQRLAIARALLKKCPILLLDEPTSSLDAHTEEKLREAMDVVMRGRTTMIIAHRMATVMHLPWIIVFDKGSVLDQGPHEELVLRCEHYRGLVASQFIASTNRSFNVLAS